MDPKPLVLSLVPLDEPQATPPPGSALSAPPAMVSMEVEILPVGAIKRENTPAADSPERFLREATKQYEEGHIDQPLWDRAMAQANNDKAAATATYLSARATALRVLDRDRRSRRRAAAPNAVPQGFGDTVPLNVPPRAGIGRAGLLAMFSQHRYWVIAAAIVPIGVAGWLLSSSRVSSPISETAAARAVPAIDRPVIRVQAPEAPPKTKSVTSIGSASGVTKEFLAKVQELTDAGNWNVLVLYAVEWTRKEPANASAWDLLRGGYVNLHQYRDALEAATKAAQLAPGDSRMWRNLGQVNMDLDDPPAALRAFDQALAASPQDATTLCLRTSVAQYAAAQKEARDTRSAPAKQVKAFDSKCLGLVEPVAQR